MSHSVADDSEFYQPAEKFFPASMPSALTYDDVTLATRLLAPATVTWRITRAGGKPVATRFDDRRLKEGRITWRWNGRDERGRVVPDGDYVATIAAATPAQAEPLTAETAAAKNAATSILPSRPTSMMPLRSENRPPMAHRMSGVATRRVAARVSSTRVPISAMAQPRRASSICNPICNHGRGIWAKAPENRITRP